MQKEKVVGIHAVRMLLKIRPFDVYEIYLTDINSKKFFGILSLAKKNNIPINKISIDKISEISKVKSHQGILALAKKKREILEKDLLPFLEKKSQNHILLVLDEVSDPRNLGACLRICDAFNVSALIIKDHDSTNMNETVKKVAVGGAETVHIIKVKNISRTLELLKKNNYWVYGATGAEGEEVNDIEFNFPLVLVMGGESKGLRKKTLGNCDFRVKINMLGNVESLNLSVATGIIIHAINSQIK